MLVEALTDQRRLLFQKSAAVRYREREFAVMQYSNPSRTLLKILLDSETQFAAEIVGGEFAERLRKEGSVELLFHGLFTKDKVTGDISMREIMRDAQPKEESSAVFFTPNKNSMYKTDRPVGLNYGKVRFLGATPDRINLHIEDLSSGKELSGRFELSFAGQKGTDAKGRLSSLLVLRRS
jgi:hypothetical protein